MSEWTKQRLEQMIADCVEENLALDYKRADSLAKTDVRKSEITKDVSSFANSSGGLIIYGIAEFNDEARRHLPERLDPIKRAEISKEWVDQIIQTIQPRIEGVVVHPVTISELDNTLCYVVEIPQSHTAHMARDHRYHKRLNFTTVHMEDYEVRDVMSRRTHPKMQVSIFINLRAGYPKPEGLLLVKIENIGRVSAHEVMVDLQIPVDLNGPHSIEDPKHLEQTPEGCCYNVRLRPTFPSHPVFPDSNMVLRRKTKTNIFKMTLQNGQPLVSTRYVKITAYADEMTPIRAKLDIAPVLLGWTLVPNENL